MPLNHFKFPFEGVAQASLVPRPLPIREGLFNRLYIHATSRQGVGVWCYNIILVNWCGKNFQNAITSVDSQNFHRRHKTTLIVHVSKIIPDSYLVPVSVYTNTCSHSNECVILYIALYTILNNTGIATVGPRRPCMAPSLLSCFSVVSISWFTLILQ